MYSAVPVGSTLGALTSGWIRGLRRPGVVMLITAFLSFLCVASLGVMGHLVLMLGALAVFWLSWFYWRFTAVFDCTRP